MAVLSDRTVLREVMRKGISIDPFLPSALQPASYDLRLGRTFRVFRNFRIPFIDVMKDYPDLTELVSASRTYPFILHPGEFVLAATHERITLSNAIVGRLEGKSSLGRLGLLIHSTAGYVDPGWDGVLTLELSNVLNLPIMLYPEMPIAQISFMYLTTEADHPYRGKYQGQEGPAASQYYRNFEQHDGS